MVQWLNCIIKLVVSPPLIPFPIPQKKKKKENCIDFITIPWRKAINTLYWNYINDEFHCWPIVSITGPEESQLKLDWPTRQKICLGIAKGLAFLHEESSLKIVHRDIKTTNVLLDRDLNAKISDFGLAKFVEEENTHISTRVAGTRWAAFLPCFSLEESAYHHCICFSYVYFS